MNVKKAVVTAAGRAQRGLPLQTVVDRDGVEKKALQIVLEEVADAGIEQTCLVVAPGDEEAYRAAAGVRASGLRFVVQTEPLGYGHAVLMAHEFTGGDPFLHLVSDHLFISRGATRSAKQVADLARAEGWPFQLFNPRARVCCASLARSAATGWLFAAICTRFTTSSKSQRPVKRSK